MVFLLARPGFSYDPKASQIKTSTATFGKNLSSADTDVQKALETLDSVNIVHSENDPIFSAWDKDYADLSNKPTIPTALSSLSDDSTHRLVTDTEKSTWNGKQDAGAYLTEEEDPSFSSWASANDHHTNWDTAYGWGDHAGLYLPIASTPWTAMGYLTEETDPVFSASESHSINSTDTSNWDAAFGWGNHAGLYLPIEGTAEAVNGLTITPGASISGANTGDETATSIKTKLGISTLSGSNTGDETASSIKTKLEITTLSGSNTGDQDLSGMVPYSGASGDVSLGSYDISATDGIFTGNVLIGTTTDDATNKLQVNGQTVLGGNVLVAPTGSSTTRQTWYGIPFAFEVQFDYTNNGDGGNYSYPMGFINTDGVGGNFVFTSFSNVVGTAHAGMVQVENNRGGFGFSATNDITLKTNGWTSTPSIIVKHVSKNNDKIGINTSAPDKALEVNLGTTSAARLTYNDNNGSAAKYNDFTVASTGALTLTNTANIFTLGNGVADTDITLNFTGTTNSGAFKWMEDEDYFQFSDDIKMADNETIVLGGTGYVDSPSYKVGGVAGITASGTSCTITAITGGIITGATCS